MADIGQAHTEQTGTAQNASAPDLVALQAENAALRTELAEARRRLDFAFEASSFVGSWDWHIPEDRVYADNQFALLYSVPAEMAARGAPIAQFVTRVHPADLAQLNAAIQHSLEHRSDFSQEYRLLQADGTIRWVFAHGRCLFDLHGRPQRFPGIAIDITARKAAERRLRETEADLRLAMQLGQIGQWSHDLVRNRHEWDERMCEIHGGNPYAGSAPFPEAGQALLHPDDVSQIEHAIQDALRQGGETALEYRIRKMNNGEERWLQSVVRTSVEGGTPTRFFGVTRDITDIKRDQQAMQVLLARHAEALRAETRGRQHSEAEGAALFDNSPIPLHSLGPDARILRVNRRWLDFMGYMDESQVVGRPVAEFMTGESAALHSEQRWPLLLQSGDTHELEYRFVKRDGQVADVLVSVQVMRDAAGTLVRTISAVVDVTDMRRTEQALRQAQKMEAVGQLTGGIAHDFNNLLTGIVGSLELMQTRIGQGRTADLPRYLEAATASANRAASLTHRLLAFARRQPLNPRPVQINRLVASMEDLLHRSLGEHVTIDMVLAGGVWPIMCDPNQLENALLNLAINARDAMAEGGRLRIETANVQLGRDDLVSKDMRPGAYVMLSVSDTGAGMTPEVQARAFDPFFTTKPLGKGTGLGLSMVYGFVRQSGGQIRILSKPGQGSTVQLYLPYHRDAVLLPQPDRPAGQGAGLHEAQTQAGARTVLVVEDEPIVRGLVVEALHDAGFSTHDTADAASGLELVRALPQADLLITDIGLPGGMNGRELAQSARRLRPDLPVLFITGYAEGAAMGRDALDPGMQLLTKPFVVQALVDQVVRMLAG